jgi:hypothetical protein
VPFEELVAIAERPAMTPFVCEPAPAAWNFDTTPRRNAALRGTCGLFISMATADFNVPLNNDQGPNSLRNIGPSLDVAETVGCDLIRVCLSGGRHSVRPSSGDTSGRAASAWPISAIRRRCLKKSSRCCK